MLRGTKSHLEYVREVWGDVANYVRNVWGPEAEFDLVGRSCLIHLDRPDPAARRERIDQFAARTAELAHADCPLCREMADLGGDEVFDREAAPQGGPRPERAAMRANADTESATASTGRAGAEGAPATAGRTRAGGGAPTAGHAPAAGAAAARAGGDGGATGAIADDLVRDLRADAGAEIRATLLRCAPALARAAVASSPSSPARVGCRAAADGPTDGGMADGGGDFARATTIGSAAADPLALLADGLDDAEDAPFDLGPWSRAGIRFKCFDRMPPRMARLILLTVLRSHAGELEEDLRAVALPDQDLAAVCRLVARAGLAPVAGEDAGVTPRPGAARRLRRRLFGLGRWAAASETALARLIPEKIADLRDKLSRFVALLEQEAAPPAVGPNAQAPSPSVAAAAPKP
ncbi:MAG: hypothetical protein HZA54_01785 [Planctomycetes bacterium]|nr:hypothetical protein [Planctomycetota bacterium]